MNKLLVIVSVCVLIVGVVFIGGCVKGADEKEPSTTAAQEQSTAVPTTEPSVTVPPTTAPSEKYTDKEVKLHVGDVKMLQLSQKEDAKLKAWKADKSGVVTVDSGGRVDALKTGKATVTATFSDKKVYRYNITVAKAQKKVRQSGYTNAITANTDIAEKNQYKKHSYLYRIEVNRTHNCVTVYTFDEKGKYTVPVRVMLCSTGMGGATITGEYTLYFKERWQELLGGVYGQYANGIYGNFLFHSVPYYTNDCSKLEVEEFNKLGSEASAGCVRLSTEDARWIFKHCDEGTPIRIFDSDKKEPLGLPEPIHITDFSIGWDPTDRAQGNPYNSRFPAIVGAKDCTVAKGSSFSAQKNITATDTCGNDITKKLTVVGKVNTNRPGRYKLTYRVTDVMHRSAKKDIWVTVK